MTHRSSCVTVRDDSHTRVMGGTVASNYGATTPTTYNPQTANHYDERTANINQTPDNNT